MSTITHWTIVAAAFVAAMVLLCFGVRRLPQQPRLSLFNLALMFFLMTCGVSGGAAEKTTPAVRDTAIIATKSSRFQLPPELSSPKNWAQFKALWEKLNAVAPKAQDQGESYGKAISREQATEFRNELAGSLGMKSIWEVQQSVARTYSRLSGADWRGKDDVKTLSIPALALANITIERIEYMQRGDRMMYTRMMAAPSSGFRAKLSEDLEKRLDVLTSLRNKGVIGGKEFTTALRGIQNDIYLHTVLNAFWKAGHLPFSPVAAAAPANPPKELALTRMAMPVSKLKPGTQSETDKNIAEIDRRIETLHSLKKKKAIKDGEYKAALSTLRSARQELLYFDPNAWIRGYEQAAPKPATRQQQQARTNRREIHHNRRELHQRGMNSANKIREAKSRIDAVVAELEKP